MNALLHFYVNHVIHMNCLQLRLSYSNSRSQAPQTQYASPQPSQPTQQYLPPQPQPALVSHSSHWVNTNIYDVNFSPLSQSQPTQRVAPLATPAPYTAPAPIAPAPAVSIRPTTHRRIKLNYSYL